MFAASKRSDGDLAVKPGTKLDQFIGEIATQSPDMAGGSYATQKRHALARSVLVMQRILSGAYILYDKDGNRIKLTDIK